MVWVALTIAVAVTVGVRVERRAGLRAQALSRHVLMAMLYVLAPFAAFFNIARLDVTADVRGGVLAGWIALVLAGVVGWVVGRFALHLPRPSNGVLINAGLQGNTGYLGLPIVAAVLGSHRLSEAIAYDALVQSPTFLIASFAVAVATGSKAGETVAERTRAFFSRNPPLLATLAGLAAPDSLAPDGLLHIARIVVLLMLPLGFFAVGITLAAESDEGAVSFPPPLTRPIAAATVLRLVVAPALLLAISVPFFHLPAPFLILAAMPAGLNSITLAHAYGLDVRFAAGTIAWSTTVAVVVALVVVALV